MYPIYKIMTERSSVIQYQNYPENRCLSPIRSSCRPPQILLHHDNYPKYSPKRLSRTPIRQQHYRGSQTNREFIRTPKKQRTPLRYHKSPLKHKQQPIIAFKPLSQPTNYSVTLTYQNQSPQYSTNPKLFTNLVNKLSNKTHQNNSNKQKENLSKQQVHKCSFSSILQNIKAVQSIQYVQTKSQEKSKIDNSSTNSQKIIKQNDQKMFQFGNVKPQNSITIISKPQNKQLDFKDNSGVLNYSFKQVSANSIKQFEDLAALLKKIQGNNTKKEEAIEVNASLEKSIKESLSMDPFL